MNFPYIFVITVSALASGSLGRRPPHIIFIVADDLGWNDVGWRNNKIKTPRLDNLARSGVILNSSYVLPLCTPTRSAFMTGYYPIHTGLQNGVIRPFDNKFLSKRFPTMPEKLKPLGYTTHIVGKWHLGHCNWDYTPTFRGFDSFLGFLGGSEDYFTHKRDKFYDFRFNREVYYPPGRQYSSKIFADRAVKIINTVDPETQQLYLYLAFQSVHGPLQVPEKYKKFCKHIVSRNRRIYCGMVKALDDAVGKVVDALKSRGFMENALIVFTTDNGGCLRKGASNFPLRGEKAFLWEGGTRGTAFVYSENLLEKTRYVNNEMIHAVDWFPTLLTLAGGTPDSNLDGINQWQTLCKGADSSRHEFLYNIEEVFKHSAAVRVGKYKLIHHYHVDGVSPPTVLLFDLEEDPVERNNLASKLKDVVKHLEQRLAFYRETKQDPKVPIISHPPHECVKNDVISPACFINQYGGSAEQDNPSIPFGLAISRTPSDYLYGHRIHTDNDMLQSLHLYDQPYENINKTGIV